MRGVEGALYVLDAVRKGQFASEALRKIAAGVKTGSAKTTGKAEKVEKVELEMTAPDLSLASSLVYIVLRRRDLWRTVLDGFLGKNNTRGPRRDFEKNNRGFDSLPFHVQDSLLIGAGGLLELKHFVGAVLVNAILNELRNISQANGERRDRWVPLVNAVLRGVSEQGAERLELLRKSPALEDRALWAGVPVWSLPAWSRTWARPDLNKLFEGREQTPASCIRVASGHRDEILKRLEQAEIEVASDNSLDELNKLTCVIRLKSTVLPTSVPGFQEGLATVQTESSVLVTSLVQKYLTGSGRFVLDMCSGRGVKAGQILQGSCCDLLEAWELSEGRHRAAKREMERLAVSNPEILNSIILRQGDARKLEPLDGKRPDFVLLDAPCSGSGTWNRKPESKWRLNWEQLDKLVATQKSLLKRAIELSGGYVLYITCSLLKQENENVVADVLARHPNCTEIPVNFGIRSPVFHKGRPWGTYIWPETPWLDGFYCALILVK